MVNVQGQPHIVVLVNDCRARVVPLKRVERTITPTNGEPVKISAAGAESNICPMLDWHLVLERRGQQGYQDFLASKRRPGRAGEEQGGQTTTEEQMKTKKAKVNKGRARGGLAADALAAKESGTTNGEAKPKRQRKAAEAGDGAPKVYAKGYIEELCNGGETTKAEAIKLVVEKFGVTEKAAKGAVNNCRHFQKKEGRKMGEWKAEPKPEKAEAAA